MLSERMLRSMLFCLPNQLFQGPIHVLVPKAPDKRLQHGGSCLHEALRKGIFLLLLRMFASILGTMTCVKQMSTKDRSERKKHMGVWRRASPLDGCDDHRVASHIDQIRGQEAGRAAPAIWGHCSVPEGGSH